MRTSFFFARGRLAPVLAATLALGACWDGGDEAQAPGPPAAQGGVPASATASSRAYANFVAALPASETAAPLDLGDYLPPTSETDAPESVN